MELRAEPLRLSFPGGSLVFGFVLQKPFSAGLGFGV